MAALPRRMPVYRQYLAFAHAILDKLDVWQGKITLASLDIADPDGLHGQMGQGRGQILVGSHLGNIEVCRALAERTGALKLNVLVHDKHAARFSRLLNEAGGVRWLHRCLKTAVRRDRMGPVRPGALRLHGHPHVAAFLDALERDRVARFVVNDFCRAYHRTGDAEAAAASACECAALPFSDWE